MSSGSKREFYGYSCFECGKRAQVAHHIIPYSVGGRRTIPLCNKCHALIHGHGHEQHALLTKKGMARARAAGKVIGGLRRTDIDLIAIEKMYHSGASWKEIIAHFGVPRATLANRLFEKYGRYGFDLHSDRRTKWHKKP